MKKSLKLNISFIIWNGDENGLVRRFNDAKYRMHYKLFQNYTNTHKDDNDKLVTKYFANLISSIISITFIILSQFKTYHLDILSL